MGCFLIIQFVCIILFLYSVDVFFFFSAGIFLLFINKVFFIEYILNSPLKLDLVFPIIIDSYGLLFSSLVLYISGNIFSFSSYYMEAEIFISRFINIVVLFVMSINFLIYPC